MTDSVTDVTDYGEIRPIHQLFSTKRRRGKKENCTHSSLKSTDSSAVSYRANGRQAWGMTKMPFRAAAEARLYPRGEANRFPAVEKNKPRRRTMLSTA